MDMTWAVLSMRRMSLNEGGTKRREEIARWRSCDLNASSSASGVKKVEMVGTSIFNFDRALGVSWRLTASVQCLYFINTEVFPPTMITDEILDVPEDVSVSLM